MSTQKETSSTKAPTGARSHIEWSAEADEFLELYAWGLSSFQCSRHLVGATPQMIEWRAQFLDVPLGTGTGLERPRGLGRDVPFLPSNAVRKEWALGVKYRIPVTNHPGIVSITINNGRGHEETQSCEFAAQLEGEDEAIEA